jgi:ferredoxin/flavodoxin---NADP+ reductase
MKHHPAHLVCVFGGAVAGSEAAYQFASRGIYSIVFDMGVLPWGKIEWGLPKWHARQRDQEEAGIDEKLSHPYVRYVPSTKLGSDIHLVDALEWGVSAVLLAVGAWRDRPLRVPRIDEFVGKGFYYQNPFVAWFNQYHSPHYAGPELEIHDDAVVVGGGLASIDVVKILMLENTERALKERGYNVDIFTLEKKGIPKTLEALGVRWEDLGIKGCTLYYRRRAQDMPLVPLGEDPSPQRRRQVEKVRQKLLQTQMEKYLFRFQPCSLPVAGIAENDRLAGLVFRRTQVRDGRVTEIAGSEFEVRSPLVISSIGSIPEPVSGVSMDRELFGLRDMRTGQLHGFHNVFALGNAVTGKGNIRASRIHGREVATWIMDDFLNWREPDFAKLRSAIEAHDQGALGRLKDEKHLLSVERIRGVLARVEERQRAVGYHGDYRRWVEEHRPVRLESL